LICTLEIRVLIQFLTSYGNINILKSRADDFRVKILNPSSSGHVNYIKEVESYMNKLQDIDIFVASAGFDQGIDDWGNLLYPEDYYELGNLMKNYSEKLCKGKRYALLEGGYNHSVLPKNVYSFCQGFK
jgi:acetoin utilization deacetylase AcuC-like enzyme